MQQLDGGNANHIDSVTKIVSSYVANQQMDISALPKLISLVSAELNTIATGAVAAPEREKTEPAVAVRKSITPDYIVDLFTGKKFKSLKRHLRTVHDMTPEQYRDHWNLPKDYPMVAPNYAKARSELAKQMGLGVGGRKARKNAAEAAAAAPAPVAAEAPAPVAEVAAAPKAPKAPKAPRAKKATAGTEQQAVA